MTQPYTPPGVTVQEQVSPSVTPPLISVPGTILLVGKAASAPGQSTTELLVLVAGTPSALQQVPTNATNVVITSVMDATNPAVAPNGFVVTTDYTFNSTTNAITRVTTGNTLANPPSSGQSSITLSSGAVPAVGQVVRLTSISLTETLVVQGVVGQVVTFTTNLQSSYPTLGSTVTWGNIPDGDGVFVTYTYLPADYWQPIRLNNMADIQNRFGPSLNGTGTGVQSRLSFGAQCALENGATSLILQPFYKVNNQGVQIAPSDADVANAANWTTVWNGLLGLDSIDLVVPIVGQSNANVTDSIEVAVLQTAQDYLYAQQTVNQQYLIAIMGEDSTASTVGNPEAQEATLQAHSTTLAGRYNNAVTQSMVLLNTGSFTRLGNHGTFYNVGGQYMAAAIAGMVSARNAAATITRQPVSGFVGVGDIRTLAQKNTDAGNGLLVVEARGQVVQVRHGITMDLTSVATRELNVVHGKHVVVATMLDTLDTEVIGKVRADADAPTFVNSVVSGALEDLRGLGFISSYADISSRITSIDPTAMEVRFSYQPVFYVNYITVVFSLDLTQNNIAVTATGVTT